MTDEKLSTKHCKSCEKGGTPLDERAIADLLERVPGWSKSENSQVIERTFRFRDYPAVLLFANSVAWIAQGENHHPVLEVSYNRCIVRYSTHSIGGLSDNDFVCAAKVNELYEGSFASE